MASLAQLRWIGLQPVRASRIPQAKWEVRKDEICAMYMSMTLEQLTDVMKTNYGFIAS